MLCSLAPLGSTDLAMCLSWGLGNRPGWAVYLPGSVAGMAGLCVSQYLW